MVAFPVSVPAELGEPDGVEVAADGRMVSMSWTTDEAGVVRLDQFDGRLDYSIAKTVPDVSYASVNGSDALWFDDAHEVTLLNAGRQPGHPRAEARRAHPDLAGRRHHAPARGRPQPRPGDRDRGVGGTGRLTAV